MSLANRILLGGLWSPGVVKLSLPELKYGWENQQAKGSDGGETVNNGKPLYEFSATWTLWEDVTQGVDHYAAWAPFAKIFELPIAKGSPKALDIFHPQLEAVGVRSVVVATYTPPAYNSANGQWTTSAKFLQYSPSKPKQGSAKPQGSKTNGSSGSIGTSGNGGAGTDGKPVQPDPNADKKAELDRVREEFDRL